MKKLIRLFTLSVFSIFTLTSLTSCGLVQIEKDAKEYMKDNPDDYDNFNTKGFGLSYKSNTLSYDFFTSKGTYTTDNISFKFDSDYEYESEHLTFKITKITNGKEDSFFYTAAVSACKIELSAMFATVEISAGMYQNQQKK